jgi:hypothetical protein
MQYLFNEKEFESYKRMKNDREINLKALELYLENNSGNRSMLKDRPLFEEDRKKHKEENSK